MAKVGKSKVETDNDDSSKISGIPGAVFSKSSEDDCIAISSGKHEEYSDINRAATTTAKREAMRLPLHTRLPDGCHVTVNSATERQVSQMYALIQAAAALGEGYGVDEYPTEDDFRQEIKGGHTFVVMTREALQGEDLEDDEVEDEEEEKDNVLEKKCSLIKEKKIYRTGRFIAAFALVTNRFYRGYDVKVADPIVIVRREERGKGIGEFVFRLAVQFSRRMGFAGIYTDTFCNNTAAMRFVESHPGFKLVGYLPLAGKMPDGTIVGANLYFKDLRSFHENSISRCKLTQMSKL